MHLAGQHERRARPDAGYAMAVLLAGIAIMGIVWTLVVPVWKQSVQREKEAELIFRAGQYARAVALYQRKYANAFPPSVEVLLREKFLRKKYKDPVTNGEFRYLSPLELQSQPGLTTTTPFSDRPGLPGGGGPSPGPGAHENRGHGPRHRRSQHARTGRADRRSIGGHRGSGEQEHGGSIKVFKNRRQYNQWIVTVQDVMPRSAVGGPQPGQQPGTAGTRRAGPVLRVRRPR